MIKTISENFLWKTVDDDKYGTDIVPKCRNIAGICVGVFIVLPLLFSSFYITQEGYRGGAENNG